MSETIGQINAPSGELLDVNISGPWKNGLYRMDLTEAEGEYVGMPWMQVGKNVEDYVAPEDGRKYVLLKNYAEARGYPDRLYAEGIVDFTERVFVTDHGAEFYEATVNDGTEREYELNATWEMAGKVVIMAKSQAEAINKSLASEDLPDDASYVDDSFDVETDGYFRIVPPLTPRK